VNTVFQSVQGAPSKAPKFTTSSDLRGHAKFIMLTASEDFVFPGTFECKTLRVKTLYVSHLTAPGTNEEVCRKI